MATLPVYLMLLGVLFWLEEWSSENPSFVRAGVFGCAVIQSTLALAFRT